MPPEEEFLALRDIFFADLGGKLDSRSSSYFFIILFSYRLDFLLILYADSAAIT